MKRFTAAALAAATAISLAAAPAQAAPKPNNELEEGSSGRRGNQAPRHSW